ncbi:MAG: 50S ribosomal protein L24 [Planctomycetes bacterium]|nr:50S ribosomal protein L24 [Planctomycetota bacterium]
MHVRSGDLVKVIAGNHKGKTGKISKVLRDEDRVVVEGVNIRKKRLKKTQQNPKGGEIEQEVPIHVSNVALWDDKAQKIVKKRKDLNA